MKKIIPALTLLLISAVIMSTASFAWFSMNTQVTANGMSVTAVSDAPNLVIAEGTVTDLSSATPAVNATLADVKLYPVAPVESWSYENVEKATSWGYAYSTNANDAATSAELISLTGEDGSFIKSDNNFEGKAYLAKYTFTIGLKPAADNTSGTPATVSNLKLTSITITENKGIVAIVNGTSYSQTNASANQQIAASISSTQPASVTVYVYINGKDANVKTQNLAQLTGDISLTFNVDNPGA